VLCFIAAGVRALGASSRTHAWTYPGFNDIFDHAEQKLSEAHAAYAGAHLKSVGRNLRIVQLKGGYLNAAVFWFRLGLSLLVVVAVMFLAYSISSSSGRSPSSPRPPQAGHDHRDQPQGTAHRQRNVPSPTRTKQRTVPTVMHRVSTPCTRLAPPDNPTRSRPTADYARPDAD
jgi:hypothetical protein